MIWTGAALALVSAAIVWSALVPFKPDASAAPVSVADKPVTAPVAFAQAQPAAQPGPPIQIAPKALAANLERFKAERGVVLIVNASATLPIAQLKQRVERDSAIAPLTDQLALGLVVPPAQKRADEDDSRALPLFYLTDSKAASAVQFAPTQSGVVAVDYAGWMRHREEVKATDAATTEAAIKRAVASLPLRDNGPFGIEVGQAAPNFVMRDANGILRRMADLRGKKQLLLTFFPRCFTFHCGQQLASLRDNYKDLQAADLEVWGVSTDVAEGEKGQRAYGEYLKLPFPLLPDEGRNLSLLLGAVQSPTQMATRMSILIDKEGIVRDIDKQINPKTHGTDVLKRLKQTGSEVDEK